MHGTQGCRLPSLSTKPTFKELYGTQLERDAVLLGEDVDSTARLGHQVQVELQTHGGGCGSSRWQTSEAGVGGTASGDRGRSSCNGEQERLGPSPSVLLNLDQHSIPISPPIGCS